MPILLGHDGEAPKILLAMREKSVSAFVVSHANLAIALPDQFDTQASHAWKYLEEYFALAVQHNDPDIRLHAEEVKRRICRKLHEANPAWTPPDIRQDDSDLPDIDNTDEMVRLRQKMDQILGSRLRGVDRIVRSVNRSENPEKALSYELNRFYSEMTDQLSAVVSDVGLNHHSCRFILALGLIASGQMKSLASMSVTRMLKADEDAQASHGKELSHRQKLPSSKYFGEQMSLLGTITSLAELTESLQISPSLRGVMFSMLRRHNAKLLQKILSETDHQMIQSNRSHTEADDLALLLKGFSQQAKTAALDAYDSSV